MHDSKGTTNEVIIQIKEAFSKTPVSTRSAVKALNNAQVHMCNSRITEEEARNIYFYILRGLGTEDVYLRSLLYSMILFMRKNTKDSFLAINSLMKDLNSDTQHIIKGKGLITLFLLLPPTMTNDFEKFVTQGLVSRFEQRKDAAVIIAYLNAVLNKDDVKRWVSTLSLVQNIPMRDYHAFALFSHIKDHKFIEKLIVDQQRSKGPAGIVLVNLLFNISKHDVGPYVQTYIKFMRSSDEMVALETIRMISKLNDASPFIDTIISVLKKGLVSKKKSVVFASIRITSALSMHNNQISQLNKEIEDVVGNVNKTVSMMAITTLLKTGNEQTIDRLIDIIPNILEEMNDSSKIIVISALESLSLKYKSKEEAFLSFMKSSLHGKGNVKFKRHIISVMERILIQDLSFSERILEILSNYIEDSPDCILTMDIIGFMGLYIGKSCNYKKYIVHVFNRLILDNAQVKCASLQALFFIFNDVPEIRECIMSMMLGYADDEDDLVSNEAKFLLLKIQSGNYFFPPSPRIKPEDFFDLKDEVLAYLDKDDILPEEKKIKIDPIIKKTKETLINDKNDDFNLLLTKFIYSDRVILSLRILNKLEGIAFRSGQINFVCNNMGNRSKTEIKIPPFKSECLIERCIKINQDLCVRDSIEKDFIFLFDNGFKISQENELIFNGNFVYEICEDEDFGEVETDSISFTPFSINMFDYIVPFSVKQEELQFERKFTIRVPGDVIENKNKIKNMFNMMVMEEESKNGFKLKMSGKCSNDSLLVSVVCNKNGLCETLINASNEMLLENVMRKVCE